MEARLSGQDSGHPENSADPQIAGVDESSPPPRTVSLRAKGIVAFILLVCYALLIGVFSDVERKKLLVLVEDLERVHRVEEQLVQVNTSMARTQAAVTAAASAGEASASMLLTLIEIEAALVYVDVIGRTHPGVLMLSRKLHALVDDMVRAPSQPVLELARATVNELVVELDEITQTTHAHRLRLLEAYRETYDRLALQGFAMVVVGLIVLGAVTATFFNRLAWDIRKLERHAREIVDGHRGEPLAVTRNDELGGLMTAVNQMQHDLRERERHIERARQEQFHREKMAAVGSLAAQLAHEINNPIAAITGVAAVMNDVTRSETCANHGNICQPGLILEQARRISLITRQISDFTRPQPLHPELLDLNQLIRNTCNFVGYDRRFRGVELCPELDSDLPAVRVVADHVTQVLMNVLINAADALEDGSQDGPARIVIRTHASDDAAVIEVADNGRGMDAETLERAFDEYFTTKEAGRGSGLGLPLSRELIRSAGGEITLTSVPGQGTVAHIVLPLEEVAAA